MKRSFTIHRDIVSLHRFDIREIFLWIYLALVCCSLVVATNLPNRALVNDVVDPQIRPVDIPMASGRGTHFRPATADVETQIIDNELEAAPAAGSDSKSAVLPEPTASLAQPIRAGNWTSMFMPIDYTLPGGQGASTSGEAVSGDAILVSKPVLFGSEVIGTVNIAVDGNSRLLVASDDLRRLIFDKPGSARVLGSLGSDEMVSFATLRKFGLQLRYDPNEDVIMLQL